MGEGCRCVGIIHRFKFDVIGWEGPLGWAITRGYIAYIPLDPLADYVYILDLNTIFRVG